jgi:hypothetical protein
MARLGRTGQRMDDAHPDIVSVGDGLFHTLGQTYRHI